MGVDVIGEGERMDVTHSLYEPGKRGPGPHIHRQHSDSFWVLEGELEFGIGPRVEPVRLAAGGFVLVPPGVVHTFLNPGPRQARFLNFHAPSMGFADHLRGDNDDFDAFDPPDDGGGPASEVLLVEPGEGEAASLGPNAVVFKAQGRGHMSLTETTLAPGAAGPLLHRHETFVDSFYVLEGTLEMRRDGDTLELREGDYAYVPPGTAHTFSNPGGQRARFLNIMAPGGFEQYLKEVAALPGPPDADAMAAIASRYDFEAVP